MHTRARARKRKRMYAELLCKFEYLLEHEFEALFVALVQQSATTWALGRRVLEPARSVAVAATHQAFRMR